MKSYLIGSQKVYCESYEYEKEANLETIKVLGNLTAKGLYDIDVKIITDNKEIINYLEMLGSQDLRPENEEDYIQFENSIDYEIGNGTTYKIEIRTTTKKAQSEIDNLIKNL